MCLCNQKMLQYKITCLLITFLSLANICLQYPAVLGQPVHDDGFCDSGESIANRIVSRDR